MRRRLLALIVGFVLVWTPGCQTTSGQKDDQKQESLTERDEPAPEFFDEIPADTWYVLTGLEPTPRKVYEALLTDSESPMPEFYKTYMNAVSRASADEDSLLKALVDEIKGNMSPEGMKELGFSTEPYFAIYGYGPAPVMRLELGDVDKFKGFLGRLESNGNVEPTVKQVGESSYRVYEADEELRIPLVIRDGAVILSMGTPEVVDVLKPYLLGDKEPEQSLANRSTLQRIQKKYGFEKFSLGYVNLSRILRVAGGVESAQGIHEKVVDAMEFNPEPVEPTCQGEIGTLVDHIPRLVVGTTEYTRDTTEVVFGLETTGDVTSDIKGTIRPLPGLDSELFGHALFGLGMGVDIDKFVKISRRRAQNLVDDPFECEQLDSFNQAAKNWLRTTASIPQGVSGIQGVTMMIDDLEFGRSFRDLRDIEAVALVRTAKPQALVGQFQSGIPGLSQVDLKDNGVPVPLDRVGAMAPMLNSPHLGLNGEMLGLSVGVGMQDEMAVLLENPAPAGSDAVAAALSYNFKKIYASAPKRMKKSLTTLVGRNEAKIEKATEILSLGRLEVTDLGLLGRFRTTTVDDDGAEREARDDD